MIALLATCEGRGKTSFDDRRDCAIVRLFLDTGLRLGELRDLRESDVDLAAEGVKVRGKGDRVRWVYPGPKTRRALSNYLLARKRHAYTEDEALWLGLQGPLGNSGLLGMLRRRARQAGIGHVHPHQLRHTWAHMMKTSGGNDEDLMRLGGWRSRDILARYGSSAADQRAKEAALRPEPCRALLLRSASLAKCALRACSARRIRSASGSVPSGSTCPSKRRRNASRAGRVLSARSVVRAQL